MAQQDPVQDANLSPGGPAAPQPETGTDAVDRRPMGPFWTLWSGQALSLVGSAAVQFALIWWLTRETGSATVLATAAILGLLPQVALGPFIGSLVDRWNRKTIMFLADAVVAAASLILAVAFLLGHARTEFVLAMLLVRALGSAFHTPAMVASTTLMVPTRHLARIQGLNQGLQGGLMIVAAPLGAFLVTVLSMPAVLMVDVVSALCALLPLVFIAVPQPARQPSAAGPQLAGLLRDTRAGFTYLARRAGHLGVVVMGAAINVFLVPAFALLPILVREELHGDALLLGWMNMTLGVGMLAGGTLLGAWGGFRRKIITSLSALAGLGLAVGLLALPGAPHTVALAGMLLVGLMAPLVNGPIHAILQATTDPGYQGRVFSLMGSLAGVTAPLGLLLAAPVADLMGVRTWYWLGGAACLAMAALASLVPAIVRIEEAPMYNAASPEEAQAGQQAV